MENDCAKLNRRLERIEKLLLESRTERKKPLSTLQASRYLKMSKSHLYQLTSKGKIPFYRSAAGGKTIYFDFDDLDNWAFANRVKMDEGIKADTKEFD